MAEDVRLSNACQITHFEHGKKTHKTNSCLKAKAPGTFLSNTQPDKHIHNQKLYLHGAMKNDIYVRGCGNLQLNEFLH